MAGNEERKIAKAEGVQKATLILSIIVIVIIAIMGLMEYANRRTQSSVNELYDATVLDFEAYKSGLNNLVMIYSIWDESSYNAAEQNCHISAELRRRIFTGYKGSNYSSKPSVTVSDVQYDLETSVSGMRTYYTVLQISDSDRERIVYYNIVAYLKDDTLIDYVVL